MDYDFRVFDDLCEMREALRVKNHNNKARLVAGYCYQWLTRNNPSSVSRRARAIRAFAALAIIAFGAASKGRPGCISAVSFEVRSSNAHACQLRC